MFHTSASDAVIVFLRLPQWGKVKTRLASELGHDEALRIYEVLTALTLETVSALSVMVYLFYEGGLPDQNVSSFSYHLQPQGDLGIKMQQALSAVLASHPKAIIIGSDCPGLTPSIIEEAFKKMEEYDIVLGPARDGGYYLLGCKKDYPALFNGISWSSDTVLTTTLEKIQAEKLSVFLLPELNDIDTSADWMEYRDGTNEGSNYRLP